MAADLARATSDKDAFHEIQKYEGGQNLETIPRKLRSGGDCFLPKFDTIGVTRPQLAEDGAVDSTLLSQ